jgi:predicted ArsR family transcriptional regulator
MHRDYSIKKSHPESPVKIKRKREIVELLENHKKLTSMQLSLITGISRTRCNEYLRELEEEGMAKGTVDDKKKFYRLVKWEKSSE